MRLLSALVVLLTLCGALRAAALSPDELKKQNDFKKAFSTSEILDRVKAMELLDGATHPSSFALLATVATADPAKEVRIEAFKALAKMPAHDTAVARMLCNIFDSIKPTDVDTRLDYMAFFKDSEFKFDIINMLTDMGSKMRYPDLVSGNYNNNGGVSSMGGGGVGSTDPNIGIKKQRDHFTKFLKLYNELAKSEMKDPDKDTPVALRRWWDTHKNKFFLADKELIDKYRAEEKATLDKDNPLVPKTAEKTDKKQ